MVPLLRKATGLFFCLSLTFSLAAGTPESCLLFSLTSQNSARLGIINTSNRSVNLSITNLDGEIFFSKSVSGQKNYFQLLNLTQMPGGEYLVKLTGPDKTFEKRFVITNATAHLKKEEVETVPSFLLLDDAILTVSYINSHKNAVNIRLEKDNETIFEDNGLLDIALNRRYSLKKLPHGEYTAKLLSGDKTYSFPLVLK
jgi:hypothetical protein